MILDVWAGVPGHEAYEKLWQHVGGLGTMVFITSSDDESCYFADLVALANFLIFTKEFLWNLRYAVGL